MSDKTLPRGLRVFCRSALVAEMMIPADTGAPPLANHGRWKLNAGSEMIVSVDGLNVDKKGEAQPIRLVLDLASCRFKNPKIHALADHDHSKVVGYWDNGLCSVEGIFATLHLVEPKNEVEAALLSDAVRTAAFIRDGVPIQVSVGAEAGPNGSWELADGKVVVNGREYDGSGDIPLYILRSGELFESSIVPFGADDKTGRLAAKKNNSPVNTEANMSDKLKALLGKFAEKHHGLVARCVAEDNDEATITAKVHATEMDDISKALKATQDELATCKAKLAEYEKKEAEGDDYAQKGGDQGEQELTRKLGLAGATKTVKFGSSDGDDSKQKVAAKVITMTQAMKVTAEKHPELKGFALRNAARKAYPDAKEA